MARREADKPVRYVKMWTSYAHDPAFYTLTFDDQAVFFRLMIWHANASDVPGLLVQNDEPMTIRDLQVGLHCMTRRDEKAVAGAVERLTERGFLEYGELEPGTGMIGWKFARWESEQASYNRETPEQSKARVTRWRARRRAAAAASNVTPMRRAGD